MFEGGFSRIIKVPFASSWLIGWKREDFIGLLLLFSLSVESVPLPPPFQAQIIPLTSILAVLFLPFIFTRFTLTPLFKVVMLFIGFVLLQSLVALFIDVAFLNAGEIRVLAMARQVIALMMGLSVFLVLRRTLRNTSDRFVISAVIAGALPAIALALFNIFWGLTGNDIAGYIVVIARSPIVGFTNPSRSSGLSLEPAHFALYLATIVIPVTLTALLTFKRHALWLICFGAVLMSFIWTWSTTGFGILLSMMLAGALLGPGRRLFIVSMICSFLIAATSWILLTNNYAIRQMNQLLSGNWSTSIIDRFYGAFGPFFMAFSSYSLLGYGLGGTTTHFSEVVPEFVQSEIASVHWQNMVNLGPLAGRLLAETGLLGLILFATVILVCFRELRAVCRLSNDNSHVTFLKFARLGLIAYLVGAGISGPGSFALPYLWFWLAIVDARYLKAREFLQKDCGTL